MKKVYDVVKITFGNSPDYNELPEQYKTKSVMCTCKTRQLAVAMMSSYHKGIHAYEIIEREVTK